MLFLFKEPERNRQLSVYLNAISVIYNINPVYLDVTLLDTQLTFNKYIKKLGQQLTIQNRQQYYT